MSGREASFLSRTSEQKTNRSGRLGEAFCQEHFGISEPAYEIKSSGAKTSGVIVQAWQLFEQMHKQYVIVSYKRREKTISRGPNKGKRRFLDTIEKAYKRRVDVFVMRGWTIAKIVIDRKLSLHSTAKGGDTYMGGKWGLVYRIPKTTLPRDVFEETEAYTLYCFPEDLPAWTAAAASQGDLFKQGDNGKVTEEEVPF